MIFEVNWARGIDLLSLVMLEFSPFPERLDPVRTVLCAGCAREGRSGSAGFATRFDPDCGVIAGIAAYFSGSVGISTMDCPTEMSSFITGVVTVDREEHPLEVTRRTMRMHATMPFKYIYNF
jgi:hypothetical protein